MNILYIYTATFGMVDNEFLSDWQINKRDTTASQRVSTDLSVLDLVGILSLRRISIGDAEKHKSLVHASIQRPEMTALKFWTFFA